MKKTLLLLTLSAFFSLSIEAQTVSGVALDRDSIILSRDSTTTLEAIVSPSNAQNRSVIWTISDRSIVDTLSVVDNVCMIKGVGVGEAKISIMTEEGNFPDTCVITVVRLVDSIRLSENSLELTLGHDTTLISKMFPSDPTNGDAFWASSDPAIIDILSVTDDSICSIRALKQGIATVYFMLEDSTRYDSCIVTVMPRPVTSLRLSIDSIKSLHMNSEATLTAHVEPFGEANDSVRWSTGNYGVVQIVSPGYDTVCHIKATGIGEAYIYAISIADNSQKDSCYVSVDSVHVEGISLNTDSLDLMISADTTLFATITPRDATDDSVRWISRDSSIVDIITAVPYRNDTICLIKAVGAGHTTIVAETFDGGIKDSCVVTVIVPTDSVVIYPEMIEHLKVDSTATLTARVYPDSSTYKTDLEWVNLDPELAEMVIIDDTICRITALKAGVDTVYVETGNGKRSRFCFVAIDPKPVDSVRIGKNDPRLDGDTLLLNVDDSFELTTTVYPANATNDTIEFSSSDPAIARIDSTADAVYVNALQDGTATIYAMAIDGSGRKDSCIVKVRSVPATSIRLDKDTLYLYKDTVGMLIVSISPRDATDKSVNWRPDKPNVIGEVTQTDVDSIYRIRGLAVDTVLLHAYLGERKDDIAEVDIKDSCVVIVKEQLILVESDTASLGNIDDGLIKVSLKIPANATVTGSFKLQLPKGFGLALKAGGGFRSELADGFAESSGLIITPVNDSTYVFNITLAPASSSSGSVSMKEIMKIAYTIYDNTLVNSKAVYDAKFVDISFQVINTGGNYEIKEEQIATEVKIKAYRDPTGNEFVKEKEGVFAYIKDNRLYVNTTKAETVYVYLLNGSTVMTKEKTEGTAVFDLDVREKILIVRGTSGWAQKVMNQ